MKKYRMATLLLMAALGCKDKPYGEQGESLAVAHQTADFSKTEIPKVEHPAYFFTGVVELGSPVSGATVAAYKFSGLSRGEKIIEVITGHDGSFNLDIKTNYVGPLLLAATGGSYKDLATGEITSVKPAQELRSAITHIKTPEKTNINAWTTLAVARVMAKRGFWDKSILSLEDEDRISVDFSHLSYFLTGKSNDVINIKRQDFFDVDKDNLKLADPRMQLHLTHGGLSQLAKKFSDKLTNDANVFSVVDVIAALSEDLSDRIFDGKNSDDGRVFLGNNRRIDLTSYTVRKDLSEAIFQYSSRLQKLGKLSPDDLLELRSANRLMDSLANDKRPELFPEQEPPLAFDISRPEIKISFAGQHNHERGFATLDGDVLFKVTAKDNSKAAKIVAISPKFETNGEESVFGPLSINHVQNAMEVAIACDKREELEAELKMRITSKREDVYCACFEAADDAGNAERALHCFLREKPMAIIRSPENRTTLIRADLRDGIKIESALTSGLALTECFWSIYGSASEVAVLKGEGRIVGTHCVVAENIDKDQLRNGNYLLVVAGTDIAGRTPESGYLADFTVRHDMVRIPDRNLGPVQ